MGIGLTGSLVAYWAYENITGSIVADSHVNGLNGSNVGPATPVAGIIGSALDFENTQNDRVEVPDNALLDVGSQITISFWAKPETLQNQGFLQRNVPGVNTGPYAVAMDTNDTTTCYFRINNAVSAVIGNAGINNAAWNHIVASYDGTNAKIYVNGSLLITNTPGHTIPIGAQPFNMGLYFNTSYDFDGDLDEIALFNKALSDGGVSGAGVGGEIGSLWNGGAGLTYPLGSEAGAAGSDFTSILSDSQSLADALTFSWGATRTYSDPFTIVDSLERSVTFNRGVSESESITDQVARDVTFNRSISDTEGIVDSLSRSIESLRGVADTLGISDSITILEGQVIAISDSFTLADSIDTVVEFNRSLSETLVLADDLQRQIETSRSIDDTFTLADSLVTDAGNNFLESLSDTLSLAETLVKTSEFNRGVSESFVVQDVTDSTIESFISFADGVGISDSLSIVDTVIEFFSKLFIIKVFKNDFKLRGDKEFTLQA